MILQSHPEAAEGECRGIYSQNHMVSSFGSIHYWQEKGRFSTDSILTSQVLTLVPQSDIVERI